MYEAQASEEQSAATTSVQDEAEVEAIVQTFMNAQTDGWLDDSPEFGLRAYPYNGGVHQQWEVHNMGDNVRTLRNVATRRCLDDSLEYKLRTHEWNGGNHQKWIIDRDDRGVRLMNVVTRNCLDDSGAGLFAKTPNDTLHQRWV